MKYQGEQGSYVYSSESVVGRNTLDPYVMADVNVAKRLFDKRLRLAVGCKNIANVTNVGSTVAAGGVHGGGGGVVPMAIGRTWFLRIDVDLNRTE